MPSLGRGSSANSIIGQSDFKLGEHRKAHCPKLLALEGRIIMRRSKLILVIATLVLFVAAYWALRPDRPITVASGFASHVLCDAAFVSGVDPDQVYTEAIHPMSAMPWVDWALHYRVDLAHQRVI